MGSTGHGSGSLREFGTKGVRGRGAGAGGGRAERPGGGSFKSMGISETGGTMLNISQSKKG